MPLDRTLARVDDDVAAGRHAQARQRLRGLVASFPDRLDLRERLAAAYRLECDAAQAGRWSYLHEGADPVELDAFERAYSRDPVQMMKALAWRCAEDDAPTEWARARLRALRGRAEKQTGAPLSWENPRHPEPPTPWWWKYVGMPGCALLALSFVGLLLVGAVSLAAHGAGVVLGWLD
jgi:hypothetical protein